MCKPVSDVAVMRRPATAKVAQADARGWGSKHVGASADISSATRRGAHKATTRGGCAPTTERECDVTASRLRRPVHSSHQPTKADLFSSVCQSDARCSSPPQSGSSTVTITTRRAILSAAPVFGAGVTARAKPPGVSHGMVARSNPHHQLRNQRSTRTCTIMSPYSKLPSGPVLGTAASEFVICGGQCRGSRCDPLAARNDLGVLDHCYVRVGDSPTSLHRARRANAAE